VKIDCYNALYCAFTDGSNKLISNSESVNIKIPASEKYTSAASIWNYDEKENLWI